MLTTNIARRFLFSRKSHSIVNLIALVSVIAIAVPTAAMIIVLSLHNGIYDHLRSLYSKVDSPLRVTSAEGQFFEVDSLKMAELQSVGVVSRTLQCDALLEYMSRQVVATVRGVDSAYSIVNQTSSAVERGEWRTSLGDRPRAVIGSGLSYNLGLSLGIGEPIFVYSILPTPQFMRMWNMPMMGSGEVEASGVFSLEATTDGRYMFVDLDFVRELTGQKTALSSLEIKPLNRYQNDLEGAKQRVKEILGPGVIVSDKMEQRTTIYSIVESEKWMVYLVLSLVIVIASMSLIGCTLVMMSEKREAVATLKAIGMSNKKIRQIFTRLSLTIVLIGVGSGGVLGIGLSLLQQHFQLLKMAGDTLLEDSYLVSIYFSDIILTIGSILLIGYLIVTLTVRSQWQIKRKKR